MPLPPGPRAPATLQAFAWIAAPDRFLAACATRYGLPCTIRTPASEEPVVLVAEPEHVRAVYAAPPDVLHAGESSAFLEPFVGPTSILLLDGEEHLRQRRSMTRPFHGDALRVHAPMARALAEEEVARWEGRVVALPRMRALTLEVILRAVFGGPHPQLHAAVRRALDFGSSLPRLLALSLTPPGSRPWRSFERAVAELDAALAPQLAAPGREGTILAHLQAAAPSARELRDAVVTLLAAGHETTATALAWALERLARHPAVLARLRAGDPAYRDGVINEALRLRPVLTLTPRRTVAPFAIAGHELPAGVHVAPCIWLAHRRAAAFPEPGRFRPERWMAPETPPPGSFFPFGGGARRCLGAAFALMEIGEVLQAVAERVTLAATGRRQEAVRRRTVVLAPARGARLVVTPNWIAPPLGRVAS